MVSEEKYEIEAARRRLADARAQASSTSKLLASLAEAAASVWVASEAAEVEAEATEEFLRGAEEEEEEEGWEVVDGINSKDESSAAETWKEEAEGLGLATDCN